MTQRLIFCFLFPLLLTACGPEVQEETDDLGFRKEFEVDEAGVKQGFLREYDTEGNLILEEHYTDGALNGPRKVYSASGQILEDENIVMGKYTGESRSYNDDGTLAMRGIYTDGAMNGIWYSFHPNGSVKAEMTFENNYQEGPVRQWYPHGKPELSGNFTNSLDFDGPLIRYDSTGALERVLNCKTKRGCRTFWTPDSTAAMPVVQTPMEQPTGM